MGEGMTADIVSFPRSSGSQIAEQLEGFARRIRAGEFGDIDAVATVFMTGDLMRVHAYGNIGQPYGLPGLLHAASVRAALSLSQKEGEQ